MSPRIGILIATTNRIGAIEPTFISRTDIEMQFGLTTSDREQIWTDGILAFGSKKSLTEDDEDMIRKISKSSINGHAITNIIKSASRIARSEHRDIDLEYVNTRASEFSDFAGSVRQVASKNGLSMGDVQTVFRR